MSTEELSLIVAALAVVVGPAITYKLGVRRFDHERAQDDARFASERRITDLADARTVLADAAQALWAMKQEMRTEFTVFAPALWMGNWPIDYAARIARLETHRDEVEKHLDILRIRFVAEGEIAVAYRACWRTVKALLGVYSATAGGGRDRAELRTAHKLNDAFDAQRTSFLVAAQSVAGSDLDDKPYVPEPLKSRVGPLAPESSP